MKYCISNWIYGDEPLEITYQRLKKFGYDGIELEGEPDKYSPSKIKELCKTYDLAVLGIAGMYPWPTKERDLSNPNPGIRSRAVDYLKKCCDFAEQVGAPLIIVVPSAVGKTKPVSDPQTEEEWQKAVEEEWNYAVESVHKAALYAEGAGVILVIEAINRYETFLVNSARQALRFAKQADSPAVKVHLDSFHMNIEESSLAGAIRETGGMLFNFHVADSNREAVGRGHINFKEILGALNEINYDKALSLEPLPPVPNPYIATKFKKYAELWDIYAQESIENLKKYEKATRH